MFVVWTIYKHLSLEQCVQSPLLGGDELSQLCVPAPGAGRAAVPALPSPRGRASAHGSRADLGPTLFLL